MPKPKRKKHHFSDASQSESDIPDSSPSKKVQIRPPEAQEAVAQVQKPSPSKRKNKPRSTDVSSPKKAHRQTGEELSPHKASRAREGRSPKVGGRSETELFDSFNTPDHKGKTQSWPDG